MTASWGRALDADVLDVWPKRRYQWEFALDALVALSYWLTADKDYN